MKPSDRAGWGEDVQIAELRGFPADLCMWYRLSLRSERSLYSWRSWGVIGFRQWAFMEGLSFSRAFSRDQ